ncbi:hypothetical protein SCHPADRAFT_653409 [Schizopora paradoxa]|uniref:PWWP domain-containing protein n=1 Tax=Schizopora paradoxa TaxID=27342 RepID=A0A0H2R6A4_9AGAM|nr:hypothetical protein SCHPADRAFT_653409 [Schizopora paradoxa]
MESSPLSPLVDSPPSSLVTVSRAGEASSSSKAAMPADAFDDLSDLSDVESRSPTPSAPQASKLQAMELPRVGHSPVGSSITRPLSKVGVKVYGKNRTTLSSPKSPIASTSRISPPNSSPLTILSSSSPSKRKRQPGPGSPSTPSKRSRGAPAAKGAGRGTKLQDDVVDLTMLSSPPSRGRAARSNRERDDTSPSPSVRRTKVAPKKLGSIHDLNRNGSIFSLSSLSPMPPKVDEVWSIGSLKDFVWVRVNENNVLYDDDVDDYFWWPAKVLKRGIPLEVELFFPPCPTLSSSIVIQRPSQANVLPQVGAMGQIRFTSSTFHSNPLAYSSPKKRASSIPKRWQAALEKMNEEEALLNDGFPTSISALYSLPQTSLSTKSPRKGKTSASKERSLSPPLPLPAPFERDDWSPPPADDSLSIPGEPVYAKDKKSRRDYWPAEILEYVPPTKSSQKGRYKLRFLDRTELFVTRDMFYSQDEPEFATCRLGDYKTDRPTNFNDSEQDDLELQNFKTELSTKSFPEPSHPVPDDDIFYTLPMDQQFVYTIPILERIIGNQYPPAEDRHALFLRGGKSRHQLSQSAGAHGTMFKLEVDKLLTCIIHWLRLGGHFGSTETSIPPSIAEDNQPDPMPLDATNGVQDSSDIPGPSNPTPPNGLDDEQRQDTHHETTDVSAPPTDAERAEDGKIVTPLAAEASGHSSEAAHNEIVEVVELDEVAVGVKGEETKMDTPPERKSCKLEFKDLQTQDMFDYASNVLLPEATYQLLLWRNGERTSFEILNDAEETRLHEKGYQLAHQVDFVKTIERIRELKRRSVFGKATNENSTPQNPPPTGVLGRTRSRAR